MQRCRWALVYLSLHGARLGRNPKQSVIWVLSIRRDLVFENGSNAAGIAIPESKCKYSGCHCLYEHGNNDLRRMRISASPSNFFCGGTCDLYDHVSSTSRCHYLVTEQARLICCLVDCIMDHLDVLMPGILLSVVKHISACRLLWSILVCLIVFTRFMSLFYVLHHVLWYVIVQKILQWITICIMCVAMCMGIVSRKVIAWHICYST